MKRLPIISIIVILCIITEKMNAQWSGTKPEWTLTNVGIGTNNPDRQLHLVLDGCSVPSGDVMFGLLMSNPFRITRKSSGDFTPIKKDNPFKDILADPDQNPYCNEINWDMYVDASNNRKLTQTFNINGTDVFGNTINQDLLSLDIEENISFRNFNVRGNISSTGIANFPNLTADNANITNAINTSSLNSNQIFTNYVQSKSTDVEILKVSNYSYMRKLYIGNFTNDRPKIPTGPYSTATLSVYGDIVSTKSIVQISNWADKVFGTQYKLMPLIEVEKFINTNKHLPEIPSENEVIENGVDVGEMNKLLLQKVEELTLYLIEQNKKIEKLESLVNSK